MQPGIYDGISNAEYHSGPGESKSLLDLVRRSPVHYAARKVAANDNEPHTPTPAQMIGTAFHALLLEPKEFAKDYCLALRPQDVPEAVDSKDQLLAMVAEVNAGRKAKLSTSGTKDELVARIREAHGSATVDVPTPDGGKVEIAGLSLAALKSCISELNETRTGLLPTTGTMESIAQSLRDAGRPVTLWADVKAEWLRNNGERTVLSQDQWDQLHQMRDAVMAHPAASALLTGAPGVAERSVYWRDPVTGLLCRCRPDHWRADGIIVDVKTTEDASPEAFARSIANWRYHVQHAYYLDGINTMRSQYKPAGLDLPMPAEARAFVFLAVEKSARVVNGVALGVAVYVLDNESVQLGRLEYQQDLARIAECTRSGVWPGYGDKIMSLSLPQWELAKNAQRLADAA